MVEQEASVYSLTLGKVNKHFEELAQQLIERWEDKVDPKRNIEHFEYIDVVASCTFGRPEDVWHRATLTVDVYVHATFFYTKFRIVSDKLPTIDELIDRWEKFMIPMYGKTGRMDTGSFGSYDEDGNPKAPPKLPSSKPRNAAGKPVIDLDDLGL